MLGTLPADRSSPRRCSADGMVPAEASTSLQSWARLGVRSTQLHEARSQPETEEDVSEFPATFVSQMCPSGVGIKSVRPSSSKASFSFVSRG